METIKLYAPNFAWILHVIAHYVGDSVQFLFQLPCNRTLSQLFVLLFSAEMIRARVTRISRPSLEWEFV